ncbi:MULTISPECIES: molecular chaperone OsmY [Lonsdalea]|uniref:Uncharacterized protein n=2 Tax=Lonsdalea TaxID=1082702 RepID=A0ACD1JED2_9GAMM|nr:MULTISPECIES: molecular chaperone OsmY [Lonsdalea]OSM94810.1 hypothetical protein AU499_15965 [Lonsdalea populi]QPQ23836.1 molecular chaperone OsmY [Lonsdalea populi]RAT13283.1 hypothetical protein AU485_09280 [Lonsdalea quercina]RAT15857.1 hypothetical protein AU486_08940 [Lonsdalea quercina]RAT17943.1 hypothetical protein AU487_15025 [Lonsdalea populi]
MKKTKIAQSVMAVVLGTMLLGAQAMAEETFSQKVKNVADTTGQKVDSSMTSAGNYLDDSTITAKVKSALLEDKTIDSGDISVATSKGIVTLSGFVASQALSTQAVSIASKTEGVKSVSDKLQVRDEKGSQTVGAYAGDTVTTSKIKAKFLADSIVPSRNIKVETHDGIVQLTGQVSTAAQSAQAESLAKAVEGVKSVKNDLTVES